MTDHIRPHRRRVDSRSTHRTLRSRAVTGEGGPVPRGSPGHGAGGDGEGRLVRSVRVLRRHASEDPRAKEADITHGPCALRTEIRDGLHGRGTAYGEGDVIEEPFAVGLDGFGVARVAYRPLDTVRRARHRCPEPLRSRLPPR